MFSSIATGVLAHQGGWDEVLLIVGPIIAIAGIVLLAKARLDDAVSAAPPAGDDETPLADPAG